MNPLIRTCICGKADFLLFERNGLDVARCQECGALHQVVSKTPAELADWYRRRYHRGVFRHTLEHDLEVAEKRLQHYGLTPGDTVLDVGCGNGAFVRQAIARGLDAWGQDLAEGSSCEPQRTYVGPLEEHSLPTDFFRAVTLHDVLEHLVDPRALLAEVRRILKQGGTLYLDFPDFEVPEGRHHWKEVEHLWLLSRENLVDLVESAGFRIDLVENPIPGKLLVIARAPTEKRTTILLPPGIGDSYWSLVKLQGLMKLYGWGDVVDVFIEDAKDRNRAADWVLRAAFVSLQGTRPRRFSRAAFNEAYGQPGRAVMPDVEGCDYLVSFNGNLDAGLSLDEVEPDAKPNWRYPMWRSKEEDAFEAECRADFGPYVVAYFIEQGYYHQWVSHFGRGDIAAALSDLARDRTIVLMGAKWDVGSTGVKVSDRIAGRVVDLTGQTDVAQMLGLLRGADGILGFPAGNTVVGAALRRPTVLLHHKRFPEPFWVNTVPPDVVGRTYLALDVQKTSGLEAATALRGLMDGRRAAA